MPSFGVMIELICRLSILFFVILNLVNPQFFFFILIHYLEFNKNKFNKFKQPNTLFGFNQFENLKSLSNRNFI
jgi:hypothetical protein